MAISSRLLGGLNYSDDVRQTVFLALTIILGAVSAYIYLFARPGPLSEKSPKQLSSDWPIVGSLRFWSERWTFLQQAAKQSPTGNFSFHVGPYPLVGLSGDEGRKVFFESRDLNFNSAYSTLLGGSPEPVNLTSSGSDKEDKNNSAQVFDVDPHHFTKRLTTLLKHGQLVKILPLMTSDTRKNLDALAADPRGVTEPFDSVYRAVYQLIMRSVGSKEIAEDPALLAKTLDIYETVDSSSTGSVVMFPWFPTPGKLRRLYGGYQLYTILSNIMKDRETTGRREDDALQYLIDQGDDIRSIISFILGALYAGQLNSGVNAAWVLILLADNPQWLAKVREEVETMANKWGSDKEGTLADRLDSVPMEAWEGELHVLDLCLKESIRINLPGAAFRVNTSGKAIKVGQEEIAPRAFVAFPVADIHHDPDVYLDPLKFDPSRYFPDRAEDKKKEYAYVGWGAARHPCLGMRFAKLEIFVMVAYFVAYFDFELCDKNGKTGVRPPPPEMNDYSAKKPKNRIFMKYTARAT